VSRYGGAPDVAGIYAMLAKVHPEQRATYRAASSAHTAAKAMQAGRRYRTRSLPRSPGRTGHWELQPRDEAGRFAKA
jgi:hypothetical protein